MHVPVESNLEPPATLASVRPLADGHPAKVSKAKEEQYNPYLAARREWDERYGDQVSRAKKSYTVALIASSVAFVATIGLVVTILRPPKISVVAVNSSGQYLGSGSTGSTVVATEDMKRSTVSDWVTNFRMVTPDGISQRSAIDKVYSMISSGSSAQAVVSDFYRSNPPQTRALSQTVHIDVNSVLPTSEKTYEVEWHEVTRDLQGNVLSDQRWKGAFTFVISTNPPNDERLTRLNPLGLYITEASWSRVL